VLLLNALRSRELVVSELCAVIIGVGLYADPWIETISGAVENVARVFERGASVKRVILYAEHCTLY